MYSFKISKRISANDAPINSNTNLKQKILKRYGEINIISAIQNINISISGNFF